MNADKKLFWPLKAASLSYPVSKDFGITVRDRLEKLGAYIRHCVAVIDLLGKATGSCR